MTKGFDDLWIGLNETARSALAARNYDPGSFADRVSRAGVPAKELVGADRAAAETKQIWIPGVEILRRNVHPQRHRGLFGELIRKEEGVLATIGLWPRQWSAARMFAPTAKGFHVHPPAIPEETSAAEWNRKLFVEEPNQYALRPYDREQWDVMFFLQGRVEMILRDLRDGLPSRMMRFYIDGDNHPSECNVAVVIPPGVAHALRVEGSEDAIMVYGTTTSFRAEFEGRIASDVESADLPESWQRFLQAE
jgi:dTDP-4-dehydrorhamnose 3,5-epimerase-like enzyme